MVTGKPQGFAWDTEFIPVPVSGALGNSALASHSPPLKWSDGLPPSELTHSGKFVHRTEAVCWFGVFFSNESNT